MGPTPTGQELVLAALATPPRRAVLASVLRAPPTVRPDPPAQPVARWEVLGDASGLAGLLHHEGASALEAITYAQAPDTFFPTEGKPVPPETPFESLHEAESVLRALGAMGRSVPSIAASLRALKGAWPLFDRRPPESWSAAEVLAACARLMEIGAGHAAACSLLEGVWALWIASDRPDRISATATVLRALEAG